MKFLFYLILVLLLVPLQTTLLPHLSVWNIKPDLGLVAAALVGLFAGELEGLLVGLAIGWVLSLFSAGELWFSLLTNGGVGLLAGFLGAAGVAGNVDLTGSGAAAGIVGERAVCHDEFRASRRVPDVVDGRVDRPSAGVFRRGGGGGALLAALSTVSCHPPEDRIAGL